MGIFHTTCSCFARYVGRQQVIRLMCDRVDVAGHQARSSLYDQLGREVAEKGLPALTGNTSSTQGQQLSDLFDFHWRHVTPKLKRLEVPVRAIVVPFPERSVAAIHALVKATLDPVLGTGAVWYQDPQLYHANIFHASHHLDPKPASPTVTTLLPARREGDPGRGCSTGHKAPRWAAGRTCLPWPSLTDPLLTDLVSEDRNYFVRPTTSTPSRSPIRCHAPPALPCATCPAYACPYRQRVGAGRAGGGSGGGGDPVGDGRRVPPEGPAGARSDHPGGGRHGALASGGGDGPGGAARRAQASESC
eukprot:1191080-Prorocentrum_minimum.AAC.9